MLLTSISRSYNKNEVFERITGFTLTSPKEFRRAENIACQSNHGFLIILAHVDFWCLSTISKIPRLVVEADGTAFHAEGSRQSERGVTKNEIL